MIFWDFLQHIKSNGATICFLILLDTVCWYVFFQNKKVLENSTMRKFVFFVEFQKLFLRHYLSFIKTLFLHDGHKE